MTFIPLPILLPIVEVTMHSGTLTFSEGAFNVIHGIRGHKLHYSTFVIDMENKEIIDDKAIGSADSDISYDEFAAAVKSSAPCYAMIDFKCTSKDGVDHEDIICVTYVPESAPAERNALYLQNQSVVFHHVAGVIDITTSDLAEISYRNLCERARRHHRHS